MRQLRTLLLGALAIAVCAALSFGQYQQPEGYRIGDLTPIDVSSPHPYPPSGNPAVPVWSHQFSWPQASYIRLHTQMDLGHGDVLVIKDSAGEIKWRYTGQGPVSQHYFPTDPDNGIQGPAGLGMEFHTDTVFSESVTVELYARSGGYGIDFLVFEHGYPWSQINTVVTPETACNMSPPFLDFECETDATRRYNGQAVCGLARSGIYCTASLVSHNSHFMTAGHCIDAQSQADTTNLWFNYQTSCTGTNRTTVVVPAPQTFVAGSTTNHDWSVGQASQRVAERFGYIQLEARTPPTGENLYIIGHPRGRRKEITYGPSYGGIINQNCVSSGVNTHFGHRADTEGGSSGSPVFSDVSNCAVGIHTCGGCTTTSATSFNSATRMFLARPLIEAAVPEVAKCGDPKVLPECDVSEVLPAGVTTGSGSGYPWSTSGPQRIMYAYEGRVLGHDFPVRIKGLGYRVSGTAASYGPATYDFAMYVSTSRNPAGNLNATFSANHGADRVKVFDGQLSFLTLRGGSGPNPFDLRVPFNLPFEWNPGSGPLLVEIQLRSGTSGLTSFDGAFNTGVGVGRIANITSSTASTATFNGGNTQDFGLFTELCIDMATAPDAYAHAEANSSSSFPWNRAGASRVQYVYDASTFASSGRIRISRLGWRPDNGNAFGGDTYDIRVSLSTGSPGLSGTQSATFDANHGADRTIVFDGVFTAPPTAGRGSPPNGFDLELELDRAFNYNPAEGSLVIDLQMRGCSGSAGTSFNGPFNTGEGVSRVSSLGTWNATTGGTPQNFGFVLGVGYTQCPTLPESNDTAFGSASSFPWGSSSGQRAMYAYDPAELAADGPIYIQHLRWRPNRTATDIGPVSYDLRIDLSAGRVSASNLGATFASNHGSNRATVFNGVISVPYTTLSGDPKEWPIQVELDTPFYWDPDRGPLIVDLRYRGVAGGGNTTTCDGAFNTAQVYRQVHTSDPNATTATFPSGGTAQQFGLALSLCGVGCNGLAVNYGTACAGTAGLPINTSYGLPTIPNSGFSLRLLNGPPSVPVVNFFGLTQVSLDLTFLQMPGCFLLSLPDIASFSTRTGSNGDARIRIPIPGDPLLAGGRFYSQWVILDRGSNPLGVITSDGLEITLCF